MLSNASKLRAALPRPPYTINVFGPLGHRQDQDCLITSADAASCIQPLQVIWLPVGVLYFAALYCDWTSIVYYFNYG